IVFRTAVVPAPAGRYGPNVRQNPGKSGDGTEPPDAGAPKITNTTTTINVPAEPRIDCRAAVANATAVITSVKRPHNVRNFEVGIAPGTGPANVSVSSAPNAEATASDTRR